MADGAEQTLDGQRDDPGVETDPCVASAGLGHVECAVGHADHLLPAQGVELLAEERITRDSERAGGPDHASLPDLEDVLGDARAHPLRQIEQAVSAEVAGDEQELVAAPAHDDVRGAAARHQQVAELAQDHVPRGVAGGVVMVLKWSRSIITKARSSRSGVIGPSDSRLYRRCSRATSFSMYSVRKRRLASPVSESVMLARASSSLAFSRSTCRIDSSRVRSCTRYSRIRACSASRANFRF